MSKAEETIQRITPDVRYALRQLAGADLTSTASMYDRVNRALDALRRVELEIQDMPDGDTPPFVVRHKDTGHYLHHHAEAGYCWANIATSPPKQFKTKVEANAVIGRYFDVKEVEVIPYASIK
jgi:hypothetical protein